MDDRYAKLRAAQQSIGVSDWQWWDSCSFRRLTFVGANGRHGQDGAAMCAVVHPSDGHPDIQMAQGVRDFIEQCSPATIRALLADYDRMRKALWVVTEHNALHFGESHNTVIVGRAALAQEQGDRNEH